MYINLKLLPTIFKLLLKHLICALGCIFFILIFPAMIDSGIGEIIYSLFAIIVFFDILYSTCWNIGNKHRRDVNIHNRKQQEAGNEQINLDKKFGIILSLIYLLINIIFAIICILMDYSTIPSMSVLANFAIKLWNLEFISLFIRIVRYRYILWLIISVFPSIPILLGYFGGLGGHNRFDQFIKKLVYKDSKKDSE